MQKLPEAETELRESRSNFKLHILQQLWLAWTNLCRQDWNERTFHNFRTGVRLAFVMQDLCKSTHPGRPESSVGPSRQQILLRSCCSTFFFRLWKDTAQTSLVHEESINRRGKLERINAKVDETKAKRSPISFGDVETSLERVESEMPFLVSFFPAPEPGG